MSSFPTLLSTNNCKCNFSHEHITYLPKLFLCSSWVLILPMSYMWTEKVFVLQLKNFQQDPCLEE